MLRLRPEQALPAMVLAFGLALAVVLYALPAQLLTSDHLAQEARRRQQATELVMAAEAQARRGLQAVERAMFAVQRATDATAPPAAALGDLLRAVTLVEAPAVAGFAGPGEAALPGATLLLGLPRPASQGGWALPALRPAPMPGQPAVLAMLDPAGLLTLPQMAGQGRSRAMLLGGDGIVRAQAGDMPDRLGQRLAEPLPTPALGAARPYLWASAGTGDGLLQAALPMRGTSLVVVVGLPVPAPGWLPFLPGTLAAATLAAATLALTGAALALLLRQGAGQRQAALQRDARLAQANVRWQLATARADASARHLELVLEGLPEGAALLDRQLRFVAWNSRFASLAGLPEARLRPGLPVAELLKSQAGEAPSIGDYSLRQRLAGLQARVNGAAVRRLAQGGRIEDRWMVLPDDSMLLTSRLVAEPVPQARPAAALGQELAALCAEELCKRLPLLLDAAIAGDAAAARVEAHAMRGVAANFGLGDFAQALHAVEEAARADDREAMRRAVRDLPAQLDTALELLPALVA